MATLLAGSDSGYIQLITVLIIFVLVLGVTAWTTKWIAKYQKQQNSNCNIEVIETTQITSNKYLQIVRIGETYFAVAICKDTVTLLGEIPFEQLRMGVPSQAGLSFRELLTKAIKKDSDNQSQSKE